MTASANPFTFVTSLARPGGNVTGLSSLSSDLYTKRVELIKETVPALTRMGVMSKPDQSECSAQRQRSREGGSIAQYRTAQV
jgi:ABC-type uncharacterized transport system substrate-binding protein